MTAVTLTKREREEIVWASGGQYTTIGNNRIGAGLARKGLAERSSYYEPECSSERVRGGTVIEYDLTDEGVLLRDKLWDEGSG